LTDLSAPEERIDGWGASSQAITQNKTEEDQREETAKDR
jgi:hypothetical protein